LALAAQLAREHGLAIPVPITMRYPGEPETYESEWQAAVIDHIGITEWICLDVAKGDGDLLSPDAQESLQRHGTIWPATGHTNAALYSAVAGGHLLTGEGGDELFSPHGGAAVRHVSSSLRRGSAPRLRALPIAAAHLAPEPPARLSRAARALLRRRHVPWLRPVTRARWAAAIADDGRAFRGRYAESLVWRTRRRASVLGLHNLKLLAREYDVELVDPFDDPAFVAAIGRESGRWGPLSRTQAMERLFGDVLPRATLARQSKASFNGVLFGAASRAFADRGVVADAELPHVYKRRVLEEWSKPTPSGLSALLLQASWLSSCP
jgi:asparagine synthase (glutamine-hydrolysing)